MKRIISILVIGLGVSYVSFATDGNTSTHAVSVVIPEVALLDLESSGSPNFALGFTPPTEAGLGITAPLTSSSIWLNYSSIIANSGETSRTISAQVTSGTIPSGVQLTVKVGQDDGGGAGNVGTRVSNQFIPVTTSITPLINNVRSCYTGTGQTGHLLTYTLALVPGSYSSLKHDASATLTVTYTLSDI